MAEVTFSVDAREHDGTYGVTLWVDDPSKPDVTPTYRSVLSGAPKADLEELVRLWGECHQEAMDRVQLGGIVTADEYEEKLLASVILAGELMERHAFKAVGHSTIPEDVLLWLFLVPESVDN